MPTFRVRGPLDVTTAATTRADLTALLTAPGRDDLVIDLLQVGPSTRSGSACSSACTAKHSGSDADWCWPRCRRGSCAC